MIDHHGKPILLECQGSIPDNRLPLVLARSSHCQRQGCGIPMQMIKKKVLIGGGMLSSLDSDGSSPGKPFSVSKLMKLAILVFSDTLS